MNGAGFQNPPYSWAIHNGANWQDDGAKTRYDGARKSMSGDDLPVFLLEVNGAYPVFYLYL